MARRRLLTFPSILALSVAAASPLSAQHILPRRPTECDQIELEVTRTFNQDCSWFVRSEIQQERNRIFLRLEPVPSMRACARVVIDQTFRIPLPQLASGRYTLEWEWTDEQFDRVPIQLEFDVAPEKCDSKGYRKGDANGDSSVDIADAVAVLSYLFAGSAEEEPLPCLLAADADSSASLDITDAIFLLEFLFLGGAAPVPSPDVCVAIEDLASLSCETPSCVAPGGSRSVWLRKPDGCLQCEECNAPDIGDLVATIEKELEVEVLRSQLIVLGTCEACSCPSGRYYAILVRAGDAPKLLDEGWEEFEGPTALPF